MPTSVPRCLGTAHAYHLAHESNHRSRKSSRPCPSTQRRPLLRSGAARGSAAAAENRSTVQVQVQPAPQQQAAPQPPPPPPADQQAAPQGQAPEQVAPDQGQEAPPPASQWVYSYPSGQWVYTSDYGWVWVPAGSASQEAEGVPYSYLYTPTYGWTWYVSPWGEARTITAGGFAIRGIPSAGAEVGFAQPRASFASGVTLDTDTAREVAFTWVAGARSFTSATDGDSRGASSRLAFRTSPA